MAVTPIKTAATGGRILVSWTQGNLASAAQILGTALDVSTIFEGTFCSKIARRTGTAWTAGWPTVRIEGSPLTSGNYEWYPICTSHTPAVGTSIAGTTLSGSISAGATTATLTSGTNMEIGDIVFLGHTSDPTKYELVRVKLVAGAVITFEEACTYAHDNGAVVTDQASMYVDTIDLRSIMRVRGVVDNANSGQAIAAQILLCTEDSVG